MSTPPASPPPPDAAPLGTTPLDAGALDALASRDFLRAAAARDQRTGRYGGQVVTRFPPEPNGYLHIGHAKAIVVDFGVARDFGGRCHLRMDDTNPTTESLEFAENIAADVRWLGFDYGDHLFFASDMFGQMYDLAVGLIEKGLAYVDECSEEEIRQLRGTVTEAGRPGPWRDRPVADSLARFAQMRAGQHPDGSMVRRARIDLAAPNMLMRDPILYRVKHAHHYRTGDDWCIYPMYDYAHCLEDALEGVTHSICTLEFENNRALYDWVIEATGVVPPEQAPRQYEMARLELEYVVTSKRRLKQLVEDGFVDGWDDPRMPTLAGLRRRGVPPQALVAFIERVGVAKTNSRVEFSLLEHAIRDDLNSRARRMMAVVDPLEVVVDGWTPGEVDTLADVPWFPDEPARGGRALSFSGRLFIERSDFQVDPPKGFKRLAPDGQVRLLNAYIVRHVGHDLDPDGRVRRVHVTLDRSTRQGQGGGKMGSVQWVDASDAVPVHLRLYDQLFLSPSPMADPQGRDFVELINPKSLVETRGLAEPALSGLPVGQAVQLLRTGYFARDPQDRGALPVLNRTVALKDSWTRPVAEVEPDPVEATVTTPREDVRKRKKRPASELRAEARAADPALQAALVELLAAGVPADDADVLTGDPASVTFVRAAAAALTLPGGEPSLPAVARFVTHELRGAMEGDDLGAVSVDPGAIGRLVGLLSAGTITSRAAKDVLEALLSHGGEPAEIVERLGLSATGDEDQVRASIQAVLDQHPDEVARYRAGEDKLQGFFMGQVMRATRGKAEPQVARELLLRMLAG